jgi:MFS family permease
MGQTMEFVALAWLVLQLTNSALSIGAAGLAQAAPRIALVFVGGAVADRVDRRLLLVITNLTSAALYFLLATLVILERIDVWQVFVFAFLLGCVRAFDGPSRQALLPHVVGRDQIANAVALGNFAWEAPRLVGPALAGVLISVIGVGPTFYAACVGNLASAVFFHLIHLQGRTLRSAERSFLRSMLAGIEFIRRNPLFQALIGLTFFNSVFGLSYVFLVPIFARDILQVGSQGYGLLHTAGGAGAILGSLSAAMLAQSRRRGWHIILGAVAFGLLLMAFAASSWFLLSLGIIFCAAVASNIYMTAIATSLQLRLEDEYRARVMGIYGLTWSLMPLGGTLSGSIAEIAGAPIALALGGFLVASMAVIVGMLVSSIRELK